MNTETKTKRVVHAMHVAGAPMVATGRECCLSRVRARFAEVVD